MHVEYLHYIIIPHTLVASSIRREIANPSRGAEMQTHRAIEFDGAWVVADVEDVAVGVVGEEGGWGVISNWGASVHVK
jgi:hypothetical protein